LGVTLTPYQTTTPDFTPLPDSASATHSPPPTAVPAPTPTPLVYTIVADDTLTGIAVRYAVPLEDLLAANPGIDPNFLTIGMTLTIPIDGVAAVTQPTPTPVPVSVQMPVCYPLGDGRLQCLSILRNEQSTSIENIIVQAVLPLDDGSTESVTTVPPLNLLPAGGQTAIAVIFNSPSEFAPQVTVLSAIHVLSETERYLPAALQVQEIAIGPNGLQAEVTGVLSLPAGQPDAATVWLAAFAYDENENIVGIRKWVANDALPAGGQVNFSFPVYSLGPPIARVELGVEVRP
jgi:LysM repeat protein